MTSETSWRGVWISLGMTSSVSQHTCPAWATSDHYQVIQAGVLDNVAHACRRLTLKLVCQESM